MEHAQQYWHNWYGCEMKSAGLSPAVKRCYRESVGSVIEITSNKGNDRTCKLSKEYTLNNTSGQPDRKW